MGSGPRAQGELRTCRDTFLSSMLQSLSVACTPHGIQAKTTTAPIARASCGGRLMATTSAGGSCLLKLIASRNWWTTSLILATPQPSRQKGTNRLARGEGRQPKTNRDYVTWCYQESWIVHGHGYGFPTETDIRFFTFFSATNQPVTVASINVHLWNTVLDNARDAILLDSSGDISSA